MNSNYSPVPLSRFFTFKFSPIASTIISLAVAFTVMLLNKVPEWYAHFFIIHLLIDTAGIFASLCIFIVVWQTYDRLGPAMGLACAGFLVVALLDILHLYYFPTSEQTLAASYEMSRLYSYLARLSQAVILLLTVACTRPLRLQKNIFLLYALVSLAAMVSVVTLFGRNLPAIEARTLLLIRQVLWIPVIALLIISVVISFRYSMSERVSSSNDFRTALFLTIAYTSLLAIVGEQNNDFIVSVLVLKLFSYGFLCKAIIAKGVAEPVKIIKATADQMTAVLDRLPDGIILYDEDNKASFVNNAAADLLKADKNALLDLTMEELEERYSHELNAEYKKLAMGHALIFSEAGMRQAPEDIRLYATTILDSLACPVLVCDKNGDIVYANKKLKELLEFLNQDCIGMSISEFRDMLSGVAELSHTRCDISNGFSEIIIKKDHHRKVLLYQQAPILSADGETLGTVFVGSDITQLREQENVIIQQEKLALLGQMGVSIVHETKNFLTTIKGGIQLLEALTKDTKVRQIAKRINNATDDVNKIISSFLQLSKPQCFTYKETSLNQLLESTLPMLESSSYIKGVKLELALCDDEHMVMCDEFQIKQVILNIANNGIEAMANASDPVLRISTRYEPSSNRMIICIEDKGQGMPEHVIRELGKPYFTTKESGTGLGLTVCYRIIRDHKGSIDIDSKVGEGSRFYVSLPCTDPVN